MNEPHVPRDSAENAERLPWDPFRAAVLGLAIDRATAEAVVTLRDAGIRAVLLKGPSFDSWLYDRDEPRSYGDIDLLVAGSDEQRAAHVLEGLDYRQRAGREPETVVEHAKVWIRPSDEMYIDLHRTLIGVEAKGIDPWEVLAADTESMQVGGAAVEILSEPARALHVALHAALPGPNSKKTLIDLSRALERLPIATWRAAASLAEKLGAEAAFATGLRLLPAGAELAATLELRPERSVNAALLADSAPYSAWTVDRLVKTRGLRAKLRILLPRLLPKPEFMRVWYPVARRGPAGLTLAYVRRLAWFFTATAPALSAWWRASREARRGG